MITIEEFAAKSGQVLGASDWFLIDQARIDTFADVTEDHQFIHIDDARAKAETPFGGTIAHGFLTLSLLSYLNASIFPELENRAMTFNYGLNKLRFLNPVKVGARVRSHLTLKSVVEKSEGRYLCTFETSVEIEGEEVPALVAEQLAMHVITK